MGYGKNETQKYHTLLRRSLRHLAEGGHKPGDVQLSKEEIEKRIEIIEHPDESEHVLLTMVADKIGDSYSHVRRLAALAEFGPQYNADSLIPKSDLPRILNLKFHIIGCDFSGDSLQQIYDKAGDALVAGNLAAAGWQIERLKRRNWHYRYMIGNLLLAYALATRTLEEMDEFDRSVLFEGRVRWGTTYELAFFLKHIKICDPRAAELVHDLLQRPKLRGRPAERRRRSRRRR